MSITLKEEDYSELSDIEVIELFSCSTQEYEICKHQNTSNDAIFLLRKVDYITCSGHQY